MTKPGFNICVGPDPVLLKDYIEQQVLLHAPEQGGEWEWFTFWGEEPLAEEFWEQLTLQGLFQRPKVVVLRHAQDLKLDTLKKLSAALGKPYAQTWPFICFEVDFEKGKPKLGAHIPKLQCVSFAQKKGWLAEVPPLDARAKKAFIQKEAKAAGLRLEAADAERIAPALPQDAGAIRLELGKLALAADAEGGLTQQALQMLNFEQEMNIFAFLQGLQSGKRPEQVWAQFNRDSDGAADAGLFGFLAMLQREARIMWQLLAGENVFLPGAVQGEKLALARGLGFGGLSRIWDLALRADKGVKTGERGAHQAFELLIADLFRLFTRK